MAHPRHEGKNKSPPTTGMNDFLNLFQQRIYDSLISFMHLDLELGLEAMGTEKKRQNKFVKIEVTNRKLRIIPSETLNNTENYCHIDIKSHVSTVFSERKGQQKRPAFTFL